MRSASRRPIRVTFYVLRFTPIVLWLITGLLVTGLAMRFGMRAVGVRGDVPFPGLVYSLTAPLVEPFYRYYPASERFDFKEVEVASLVAAGVVIAVAMGLYIAWLLAVEGRGDRG